MDLLTVGDAFEDLIFAGLPRLPRLSEELRVTSLSRHPGGGAIITAIAAARLGLAVGTISALSRDNVAALHAESISTVNLRKPNERGAITVALSTRHDRAFVTFEGVNKRLEPRLVSAVGRLRRVPRHVHFAFVPRRCRTWLPIVNRMRRRGVTTSWDFGWHDELLHDAAFPRLLGTVDWVFVNEREATFYTKTASMRAALKDWKRLARGAVIKIGSRGVIVLTSDEEVRVTTPKVQVVDTTGAGDSFNAGFIAARLSGATLKDAARAGNYVGGRNVRAAGGIDGLPRHDELPRSIAALLEAR